MIKLVTSNQSKERMIPILMPDFGNIPDELKQHPQWVNWKLVHRQEDKKPTKPPFQPNGKFAKTNNPTTWSTFSAVKDAAPQYDGVGFVVTKEDEFVGIDFDECGCRGFGLVKPDVAKYLDSLNSYTEWSPSCTGIRVFVKGSLPVDGSKKGGLEAYQALHYLTMTGGVLDGFPQTIEYRQEALDSFYQDTFGAIEKAQEQPKKPQPGNTLADWQAIREKAFSSKNGLKIEKLWDGDFSSYKSQSEADLALCGYLAYWLGGDAVKIDSAFRVSGLMRDKWDVKHHGGVRTYGEENIQKAIAGCTSYYRERPASGKETAPPDVWPDPVPLNDYSHLPQFPVEALPGACGEMVQALANSCQVDAGLPGSMMLAVLSAAIGAKVKIVLDSHPEQGNLYLLSVLGSGNTKSAIASQLTAPLYSYQKDRQDLMIPVIRKAESVMRVLEKRLEKLQKAAADKDDPNERELLLRECDAVLQEIEENPVPTKPVYLVDDVTLERLGGIMADNEERSAILSAEGGFFKIIAGLYSKGHTANLDVLLKAYTGDAWASDRVGRESKAMSAPALTLGLAVQPDVIAEIGRNSEFRGRGLSARFLYSWCQSRAGFRILQTSPVPVNVRDAYHRLIVALMDAGGKYDLRLAPDAQAIWNGFYADVEILLRPGGELEHLVDWGSKLPGAVARLSGNLHFAEYGPEGIRNPIAGDAIAKACLLGGYYCEHAKAVFGIMKEDARLTVARKIILYIKRCNPERFKGRDLFSHTTCASMAEIQPALGILIERGYVREVDKSAITGRGRPESQVYEVNPKVSPNA